MQHRPPMLPKQAWVNTYIKKREGSCLFTHLELQLELITGYNHSPVYLRGSPNAP